MADEKQTPDETQLDESQLEEVTGGLSVTPTKSLLGGTQPKTMEPLDKKLMEPLDKATLDR